MNLGVEFLREHMPPRDPNSTKRLPTAESSPMWFPPSPVSRFTFAHRKGNRSPS